MILSIAERSNFPYILPVQGSFQTLELVEKILLKIRIENQKDEEKEFIFDKDELMCLKKYVDVLDENNKLQFQCLSLARKIKGERI